MDKDQWAIFPLLLQFALTLLSGVAIWGVWRKTDVENLRARARDAEEQNARLKVEVKSLQEEAKELKTQIEELTRDNFGLATRIEVMKETQLKMSARTLTQQDEIDTLRQAMEKHGIRINALEHPVE
jgi:cell division protein FtsB